MNSITSKLVTNKINLNDVPKLRQMNNFLTNIQPSPMYSPNLSARKHPRKKSSKNSPRAFQKLKPMPMHNDIALRKRTNEVQPIMVEKCEDYQYEPEQDSFSDEERKTPHRFDKSGESRGYRATGYMTAQPTPNLYKPIPSPGNILTRQTSKSNLRTARLNSSNLSPPASVP